MLHAIKLITETLSTSLVGGETAANLRTDTMEAVVYKDTRLALLNDSTPTAYGNDYVLPPEVFDGFDDNDVFSISVSLQWLIATLSSHWHHMSVKAWKSPATRMLQQIVQAKDQGTSKLSV